jgi:serine protease AprX
MPVLISNYPQSRLGQIALMSLHERTGALAQYSGKGVTIAFIDSGFYKHADLKGRILAHVDATNETIHVSDDIRKSQAFSWHGQMTSVIGCGDGTKSQGRYRGIASGANLVLVKVTGPHNEIKENDIWRGLNWVLRHHKKYKIRVVNLSVGGDYVSYDSGHPLHQAVKELTQQGITVVAAAGNTPVNHLVPPASAAEAITVGGVDDANSLDESLWRLYHHNYGMGYDGSTKPDLLAPACWIPSPILPSTQVALEAFWLGALMHDDLDHPVRKLIDTGRASRGLEKLFGSANVDLLHETLQERIFAHKLVDSYHQYAEGTSVAAPIVSAVVAQMLEANPRLTPLEVKSTLLRSAKRLPDISPYQQGAGVLNAAVAVQHALAHT